MVVPHVLAVVHEQHGIRRRASGRVVAGRQVRGDVAAVAERRRAHALERDEMTAARVGRVEHRVLAVGVAGEVVVRERRILRDRATTSSRRRACTCGSPSATAPTADDERASRTRRCVASAVVDQSLNVPATSRPARSCETARGHPPTAGRCLRARRARRAASRRRPASQPRPPRRRARARTPRRRDPPGSRSRRRRRRQVLSRVVAGHLRSTRRGRPRRQGGQSGTGRCAWRCDRQRRRRNVPDRRRRPARNSKNQALLR